MFPLKWRLKILTKIAQQATQPSSGAATANPTQPTTPAPQFNPVSGPWSWITQAYNPQTVGYLSYLLRILSVAMHYATNGEHNLQKDQNDLGDVDPSGAFSVDGKNLILLAKLFYHTFLNNGKALAHPPTGNQIAQWVNTISTSQPLLNLSQLSQTGPLAQQLNAQYSLDGSLRQNLLNYLSYIARYNPAQQR
jgi:hypothetical protein